MEGGEEREEIVHDFSWGSSKSSTANYRCAGSEVQTFFRPAGTNKYSWKLRLSVPKKQNTPREVRTSGKLAFIAQNSPRETGHWRPALTESGAPAKIALAGYAVGKDNEEYSVNSRNIL